MGSVYRAHQDDLGRSVAVKTLRHDLVASTTLREQFTREAHILAQLDHPGIVPVHFAGETEAGPYYVMRLVDGVGVDRHLKRASATEVATVFHDIAAALHAAHLAGVLHRDVKPANILVEHGDRPVLVDFGLSTHCRQGSREAVNDRLVGTPDYLAPELLEGGEYSSVSDVYALGATLYHILADRVPFPGRDLAKKLQAIREDDPPPPRALNPDVPKILQAICLKAMERSPKDRYPSAEEFRRDLERFLAGDPVAVLPIRSRSVLRRKIDRHLADHAQWEKLGLLNERKRLALRYVYEKLDEEERGILRGVLTSVPNLLLFAGLILTTFGPVLLQLIAWEELGSLGRAALPFVPLVLLTAIGIKRWQSQDRRRGLACLLGASLLAVPAAFALADLVPSLQSIEDDQGKLQPVLPGRLWMPANDAPQWIRRGARLLEWKVLATSVLVLGFVGLQYRRTRSAFFLWLLGIAAAGALIAGAQLLGFRDLAIWQRWLMEGAGSLLVMALGLPFDRAWQRDRALPFYGLGFVWAVATILTYAPQGLPVLWFTGTRNLTSSGWSLVLHGLLVVTGGLFAHSRGTALLRQAAGVPMVVGFAVTFLGLSELSMGNRWYWDVVLVGNCVSFLVLGLALHRNSLVLPAAIALPFTVGAVSQRHMDAVWAWSLTVVLMGMGLVLLALRLAARRVHQGKVTS